jgi:hypothetical protein
MLRFLFPRLMGMYKEGGLIVGKFTVSNSGATLTPVAGDCHQDLTAAGDSGQYVVTLKGGARHITVVSCKATLPDEDDPADARQVFVNGEDGVNAGAGTIPLVVMDLGVDTDAGGADTDAVAVADLVDTSVLEVVLYVDK